MASVTAKRFQGRTYYYLRVCKRVDGRPRIVHQEYLGTAADLARAHAQLKNPPRPSGSTVRQFGAVAVLWRLAADLDVAGIVDRHVPKRRQGLTPGQYLLLAALNRAVGPTSKAALAGWYKGTSLWRWLPATPEALASQRFWDHFDRCGAATLAAIEMDLSRRLVERFHVDLSALVYDGSNFFTYMDSRTDSALAKRGHNKQKRTDLRQVALGLLVSTDFHLPLLHAVYPGNVADATQFQSVTATLVERHRQLAGACQDITLIFDKGNNSTEGFKTLTESAYHFVGSLVLTHHSDLLDVPLSDFRALTHPRLEGVRAYRTQAEVFGRPRTLLLTHSPALLEGQRRGLAQHLGKAAARLTALQERLARRADGRTRGGRPPTRAGVEAQVRQILRAQFLSEVVDVTLGGAPDAPTLAWSVNRNSLDHLAERRFGKTLLFTDRGDWTDEQIVLAYRSQSKIEDVFKLMKHAHYLRWQPEWHWTDSKIRVHAFTCVLAVTLCSLLQRTLAHAGLHLSIPRILDELCAVYETTLIYPGPTARRPVVQHVVAGLNETQRRILEIMKIPIDEP
jgi:transposase